MLSSTKFDVGFKRRINESNLIATDSDDGYGVKLLRVSLRELVVEASVSHNFSLLAISPKFISQPLQ